MTLHLVKLSVGVEDLPHLRRLQQARAQTQGRLWHLTRMTPRRAEELLDGGSIYWVVKGHIRARQRVIGFERVEEADGRSRCRILLDTQLVATEWRRQRPFQGWRYLAPGDAPSDLPSDRQFDNGGDDGGGSGAASVGELPPDLAAELRDLGLL